MSVGNDWKKRAVSVLCEGGEDMAFLGACAHNGDFRPLLDGRVKISYMRSVPGAIAQTILDQKAAGGPFPPSLSALRHTHNIPGYEWPEFDTDVSGLDLEAYVHAVLASYRRYSLLALAFDSMLMGEHHHDDALFGDWLTNAQDRLRTLQSLGTSNTGLVRLGAGQSEIMNALMPAPGVRSRITSPWKWLNDAVQVFTPGLYAFFARPKQGKSWVAIEFAVWLAIIKGIPGILVDPENDRETILARIACCMAQLPFDRWLSVMRKFEIQQDAQATEEEIRTSALTEDDLKFIARVAAVQEEIEKNSKLYIIGKRSARDTGPADPELFNLDRILQVAEAVGAQWLAVEQIHKMKTNGHKERDTLQTSITKATELLASRSDLVSFVTTQENRSTQDKAQDMHWHSPSSTTVWGSDALSQNVLFLCHVRMFPVQNPVREYRDMSDLRPVTHIQCFWPLIARNIKGTGRTNCRFRAFDAYAHNEWLDYDFAYEYIDQELRVARDKAEQSRATAKSQVARTMSRAPGPTPGVGPATAAELGLRMRG